jgi:uncharacterized protein YndB with AHSA1/START domain
MIRIEMDTFIKRPVGDVFDRLVNLADYSKWMSKKGVFIKNWQTSEGPVGAGTTFADRGRMGTFYGEITDFRRPTRVAFREQLHWLGMLVMESRPVYELVSTADGAKVHFVSEGQLYGIFKMMYPMAAAMGRGERRRTLDALKKSFE